MFVCSFKRQRHVLGWEEVWLKSFFGKEVQVPLLLRMGIARVASEPEERKDTMCCTVVPVVKLESVCGKWAHLNTHIVVGGMIIHRRGRMWCCAGGARLQSRHGRIGHPLRM